MAIRYCITVWWGRRVLYDPIHSAGSPLFCLCTPSLHTRLVRRAHHVFVLTTKLAPRVDGRPGVAMQIDGRVRRSHGSQGRRGGKVVRRKGRKALGMG